MHDLLVSLANSRLRFQTTQVEYRHIKDYKPQSEGDKKEGADQSGPGRVFGPMMPGIGAQPQRDETAANEGNAKSNAAEADVGPHEPHDDARHGSGPGGMIPSVSRAPTRGRGFDQRRPHNDSGSGKTSGR